MAKCVAAGSPLRDSVEAVSLLLGKSQEGPGWEAGQLARAAQALRKGGQAQSV